MNDRLLIPTFFCPKAWEGMTGNEAKRFCPYCKKNVHNLEAMSVADRLKLLSSPAASICARYKIAIRRPAPGRKESYLRHMLKYGAGVALTGSVLVVLWEMHTENEQRAYYRAIAPRPIADPDYRPACDCPVGDSPEAEWPREFYVEQEVVTMGIWVGIPEPARDALPRPVNPAIAPRSIELDLDPTEINKLLRSAQPPPIELKTIPPLKNKKTRKLTSPRGWGA